TRRNRGTFSHSRRGLLRCKDLWRSTISFFRRSSTMRSLRNSRSVLPVHQGGLLVIVVALWTGLRAPCFSQEIVLEDEFVRYVVGPDGRNLSLTDKVGQGEQLITTQTGY